MGIINLLPTGVLLSVMGKTGRVRVSSESQVAWYFQDLAGGSKAGLLYASSLAMNEVLVFDLTGKKIASLRPTPPDKLEGVLSLALLKNSLYVATFSERGSRIELEKKEGNHTPH